MNPSIALGITLGIVIGGAFAWMQLLAARRNEFLQKQRCPTGILRQVPGSTARVAFLLMSLIAVQIMFPGADRRWLSGALAISYAIPFLWRLKIKFSQIR